MNNYLIVGGSSGIGNILLDQLTGQGHNNYAADNKTEFSSSDQKIQYLHLGVKQANADRYSLKKIGGPQYTSNTTAFLLSDQSFWITGQILRVNRGILSIKI